MVNVTGTEPVTGTFEDLPAGSFLRVWNENTLYYFTIRYDGGDGKDITLTYGAPPPQIALEEPDGMPSDIAGGVKLGSTPLGRMVTRTFVIRNKGGLDLADIHVTCTGDPRFAVISPPATLPPGGVGSFSISYLPQAPVSGDYSSATVTVTSNDPFFSSIKFHTFAQGIDLGTANFTAAAGLALMRLRYDFDANGLTLPTMTMSFAKERSAGRARHRLIWG
jgi:hypothetical protein